MKNRKDLVLIGIIVFLVVCLIVMSVCFTVLGNKRQKINDRVVEGVQVDLQTREDVTLTKFDEIEVINGKIELYVAKVSERYYAVRVMYIEDIVDVEVVKEI